MDIGSNVAACFAPGCRPPAPSRGRHPCSSRSRRRRRGTRVHIDSTLRRRDEPLLQRPNSRGNAPPLDGRRSWWKSSTGNDTDVGMTRTTRVNCLVHGPTGEACRLRIRVPDLPPARRAVQRFTDRLSRCASTAAVNSGRFLGGGVVFKGSGFYKTDSRERQIFDSVSTTTPRRHHRRIKFNAGCDGRDDVNVDLVANYVDGLSPETAILSIATLCPARAGAFEVVPTWTTSSSIRCNVEATVISRTGSASWPSQS